MPFDEELNELLARALDDDTPDAPPPDRIAALRSAAEDARRNRSPAASAGEAARPSPFTRVIRRGGVAPWLATAAAVLVAFALGVGVARSLDSSDDAVETATGDVEFDGAMTGPAGERAQAELQVTAIGIGRVVDLSTDVLPILPTGEFYEVWFVGAEDSPTTPNRISAGTFHPDPDGRSRVRFAAAVNPELYPVVEITSEQGDGNPLSSGRIVLRAVIAP